MANKNISNFNTASPVTGDYFLFFDVSASGTRRSTINRLVALTPEEAEAIAITGAVSGAQNVGIGDGDIFLKNNSGILEFRRLMEGDNVTITTASGSVIINAADPPAVPIQGVRDVGPGEGRLFNGVEETYLQLKTISAGTGISIINNTGDVVINANTGTYVASNIVYGGGNSFGVPFGGDGTTQPIWTKVTFGVGTPTLSIPAGTATYLFDFIFGLKRGSTSTFLWTKFSGTSIGNIANSTAQFEQTDGRYHARVLESLSGPSDVSVFALHSGADDTSEILPQIYSTGSNFTYLKLT